MVEIQLWGFIPSGIREVHGPNSLHGSLLHPPDLPHGASPQRPAWPRPPSPASGSSPSIGRLARH